MERGHYKQARAALEKQNPELANFIFSLSALEDSLKELSTLIFDQHTPPFALAGRLHISCGSGHSSCPHQF